ncbi:hypothetical protein CLV93_10982 [Prolixibacter denitrificans]|uniref:Uncharacterized protein n=1 Tax=Prolixibacter denitrificans TaxID=1541063 RepID=A0A2P8C940_9BACT|nr:hypothetical protein CLV93_10982 [Prolixibacter denitrificans]
MAQDRFVSVKEIGVKNDLQIKMLFSEIKMPH